MDYRDKQGLPMKRSALLIGLVMLVLAGGGTWWAWQHQLEKERAKAAEIKRQTDEAEAKARAEENAASEQEAADDTPNLVRSKESPLDLPDGPHFRFAHQVADRVGYGYENGARPPLFSHLLCYDGRMQTLTFDYGLLGGYEGAYDFYKVPVAAKGYDQICLSLRQEDGTTYKTIMASRKPECDDQGGRQLCRLALPTKDCGDAERAAIRALDGRAKDAVRWCQIQSAGVRFGFLQAVTQRGQACEIKSWLVEGGKLRSMGRNYEGLFKVDEGSTEPASCVFPMHDGDFSQEEMTSDGGPLRLKLIFELGGMMYFVHESTDSDGFTSTLYRLDDGRFEALVQDYNFVMDHDFWTSTGESDADAPESEGNSP
jgi:hypothetical protein